MMFLENKYKKLLKEQEVMTEQAIITAREWKDLCIESTTKYEEAINDLKMANDLIERLQEQRNKLVLELAFYKKAVKNE